MFQRVFQSQDLGEAEIARGLLLTAGFHPCELRTVSHAWQAGADQVFFVEVPEEEVDGVRECLAEGGFETQIL